MNRILQNRLGATMTCSSASCGVQPIRSYGSIDMNRSLDTRIRKLEQVQRIRDRRHFVIDGNTERERQAHIDELIRSGRAAPSDTFVYTGVPRSPGFIGGSEE